MSKFYTVCKNKMSDGSPIHHTTVETATEAAKAMALKYQTG